MFVGVGFIEAHLTFLGWMFVGVGFIEALSFMDLMVRGCTHNETLKEKSERAIANKNQPYTHGL